MYGGKKVMAAVSVFAWDQLKMNTQQTDGGGWSDKLTVL